ncbi:neuronal-glial cell adhesion molecule-like, partial [Passer montanus]|uniref:neuronal-glial cell adhesion molecule-like n=1 Tax=Passer montanus TaxID=9160 RepID=UPI00196017CB
LPVQILTPNSSLYAVVENQTAFLHCRAFGAPAPTLPDSGRRTLRDGALILSRLEPNDSAVAQCEASNSHGRLLANAFVYVVELPVQILTPNSSLYAVVENQTAFLHCRAFGAPAPTVEW